MSSAIATIVIGDVGQDVGEEVGQNAADRVGQLLGKKWRLDELLGVGGTGAVYAATHRNGHRVALKVLHPRFSSDALIGWRLEQEACLSNRIAHPGVVPIFDDGRTDDGAIFLVMPLLEGEALHARLARKNGQLSPGDALGVAHGVLDVLVAAHKRKVVHGDIKPENVFITRQGDIKLLDFGVGGMFEFGRTSGADDGLFGTPGYMAPEQALGQSEEVDARSDLWAVGATLHRMVTGKLVHEAPSLIERLVDAGTRPLPPMKESFPDLDPAIATLLDRALAFEKKARFADAAEMREAVRQCAEAGSWSTGPLGPALSVELPPLSAGPTDGKPRRVVTHEPTLRIFRARRRSRTTLLSVGGAAMLAASMVSVRAPHPAVPSLPALDSPLAIEAPAPPAPPPGAGQELIGWNPLPAPPAATVAHVGRRSKASKRPRATTVATDDDLWGRRH